MDEPTNVTSHTHITQWTRYGDCNHCGDCCRAVAFHVTSVTQLSHPDTRTDSCLDDRDYWLTRGYTIDDEKQLAMLPVHFVHPCPKYVLPRVIHEDVPEHGSCSIHDTKPTYCTLFPTRPDEIVHTRCSYWFERAVITVVGEGATDTKAKTDIQRVGGVGSPYPYDKGTLIVNW